MAQEFRIRGSVKERETGRPLPGLVVRAFDKDGVYDDLLGNATTDAGGRFELRYSKTDFSELFEAAPDIYFEILDASSREVIHTTGDAVRWNAGADEEVELEIPGDKIPAAANAAPPKDEKLRAVDPNDKKLEPFVLRLGGRAEEFAEGEEEAAVAARRDTNPFARRTLGDLGIATAVGVGTETHGLSARKDLGGETLVVQPLDPRMLVGIDPTTVRMFRVEEETGALKPVWNSGVNLQHGFAWAKVRRPGTYVPIGLPRDRLLRETLRAVAEERAHTDDAEPERVHGLTARHLAALHETDDDELYELRQLLTTLELQTGVGPFTENDLRLGPGGHILPFPLPREATPAEFRERLKGLETGPGGLPEEALFNPPEVARHRDFPWPVPPDAPPPDEWLRLEKLERLPGLEIAHVRDWIRYFFSRDWWMYQHDERHTGAASGASNLRSTTVGSLAALPTVAVDGPIITKPSIVGGKVYIGTGKKSGTGGSTLYKIDLATGHVDGKFPTTGTAFYSWVWGIGGSPAIVNGKVYFSAVHGKVYCVDAATMTPSAPHPAALWVTDLKQPDPAHNQPVNNPHADCWSGPLVVNGRVYVGCGEGEQADTYGFIYCLDAETGNVIWLYCTAKFQNRLAPGSENAPNVIPASVAVSNPLPAWATAAGFSIHNDASNRSTGCAVWSSCAYDRGLNRIYVGTGNAQYGPGFTGTDLPDKWYGSGLISLDATTGEFRAFFQPEPDDSYWPDDADIDVPGSPSVFSRAGERVVGFGSKNGSYFLLDPDTLAPLRRRQLLPREGGSGTPGDRGTGIPDVVPTGGSGENSYGVFGTAAVHGSSHKLFVGVGGYNGMAIDDGAPGTDPTRTPFIRALDWETLADAWHTVVGADGVSRYDVPTPPLYQTREVGLSSPAVVNDVVFVSTDKVGLYALDTATGLCLWSASGLPVTNWNSPSARYFALGPAIYGNYVVIGAGDHVYRYTLGRDLIKLPRPDLVYEEVRWPWPPEPDPRVRETIVEAVAQALKQFLRR